MVQAIINIDDKTNRVLNIVKAKFGLKDKSQAIQMITLEYENNILELELKPEYVKKMSKIMKSRHISRAEFKKRLS